MSTDPHMLQLAQPGTLNFKARGWIVMSNGGDPMNSPSKWATSESEASIRTLEALKNSAAFKR